MPAYPRTGRRLAAWDVSIAFQQDPTDMDDGNRDNTNRPETKWILVVGCAQNGVIGRNGDLPWRIKSDLRRFKSMTMGHCLLMGRKTFESIGRLLPGRQTIVLSRQNIELPEGASLASSPHEVDGLVDDKRDVMVVGGSQIYAACLDRCDEIWLTRILHEVDGDTKLPNIDWNLWRLDHKEAIEQDPKDDWPTEFERWVRKIQN